VHNVEYALLPVKPVKPNSALKLSRKHSYVPDLLREVC